MKIENGYEFGLFFGFGFLTTLGLWVIAIMCLEVFFYETKIKIWSILSSF